VVQIASFLLGGYKHKLAKWFTTRSHISQLKLFDPLAGDFPFRSRHSRAIWQNFRAYKSLGSMQCLELTLLRGANDLSPVILTCLILCISGHNWIHMDINVHRPCSANIIFWEFDAESALSRSEHEPSKPSKPKPIETRHQGIFHLLRKLAHPLGLGQEHLRRPYGCMYGRCLCMCMFVWLFVCMYVCMFVSMYLCMYLCIYVYVYVSIYVCIYLSIGIPYIYRSIYLCMYLCMYLCIYFYMYLYNDQCIYLCI
jgi:hypothetical protein